MNINPTSANSIHTTEPPNYTALFVFPNGYGASVICHCRSYGGSEGLFEIALTNAQTGALVYRDDFANGDVAGYLNFHQVAAALDQIAALATNLNR